MFHKGKHSGTPPFLKRDKAFKAALAKQYGVEKTPKHLQMVLEETYRKLPDTVPVPYRPVRRILRQTATVFAVLVLTFAALWGVNGTYPQLTEALPGLGPVFQAINGGKHPAPNPDPSPAPTATPKPTFQPVVMTSSTYSGNMTVTNAWSDGRTLFLDMELELKDGLWDLMQEQPDPEKMDPYAVELDKERYSSHSTLYHIWPAYCVPEPEWTIALLVNGLDMTNQFEFAFSDYEGGDTVQARAIATFGYDIEVGRELNVELAIPDLLAAYWWDISQVTAQYSPGFHKEFTVPVDRTRNFALDHPVSQNGASLTALDFAPSYVSVEAELPYLGTTGETLLPLENTQEWDDSWGESFLGAYPELTGVSGEPVVYFGASQEVLSSPPIPEPGTTMKFRFLFQCGSFLQESQGPLRLTFYELPDQNIYGDKVDKLALRRVVAEFTIEPSTNQVIPTEYFRQEGREQVDITRDPTTLADSGFINGFRVLSGTGTPRSLYSSPSGWSEVFELVTGLDDGVWPLEFKGYLKDEVVQTFFIRVNEGDVQDEAGAYYEGFYAVPSTGTEYRMLSVALHIPDWAVDEFGEPIPFDRVELADGETGITLIPDLTEAVKATYRLDPPEDASTSSRPENEIGFGTGEEEGILGS